MLGMGAKADVFAHAFGLGLGTVLGIGIGVVDRPRAPAAGDPSSSAPLRVATAGGEGWAPRLAQAALLTVALAAVVAAWTHALAHG
jgi:hypothetical protein